MPSRFLLQVVDRKTGAVAACWPPGLDEETDLVSDLCRRVREKGIGFGRTEAHGCAAIREAFEDVLLACKQRVREPKL